MKRLITGIIFLFIGNSILIAESKTLDSDSIRVKYELARVVITANRYEKNVFETHVPVNVISEQRIWQKNSSSYGELVDQIAGVTHSNAGPWSQKVSVRGLVGPHVLTLIDGMRVNSLRSYGNHAHLIDVSQIEKVEIIRGPASILYGSEAVAGVVNYITRKPVFKSDGFHLQGNVGFQYSTVNQQQSEQLHLSGGIGAWSFLFGLSNRQAGNIDTPQGKLQNTGFNGYSVETKLGFQPVNEHQFIFTAQTNRFKDVGVPINEFAAHAEFLKYNRDLFTFSYEYRSPAKMWSNSKFNLYYQNGERNFDALIYQKPKNTLFVNQALTANRDVYSFGGSLQNSLSLFRKNLLIFGFDVFANDDNTRRIADAEITNGSGEIVVNPPADNTPPTPLSNRQGAGIFFEDEYAIAEKMSLTFGARFDYIVSRADGTEGTLTQEDVEKTDKDFSGNFGILFRLTDKIHLTGNIGRAFKAPTLQERFFKGTAQVGYLFGNPELKSETSLNLDTGIKFRSGRLNGGFNVFFNRINNFIIMNPISASADTFLYDNVGEAELYGAEIELKYQLSSQLSFFVNNSFVRGQDVKLQEPLPKMPPLTSLLGVRFEDLSNNYWLELTSRIIDNQNRVVENESTTPGYTTFDFSSGINMQTFISFTYPLYLTLNINNILDKKYRDHLSAVTWWAAPGRNISIGLRSNF